MTALPPLDLPRADFSRTDPGAVALLAERWARRYGVIPLHRDRGTLVVATSDPLDLDAERAVAFATGHRVRWAHASPAEVAVQLARWYPDASARSDHAAPPVEVQHLTFDSGAASSIAGDDVASVVRLVDQILADGIHAHASDIHIEPEERGIALRHRVDGVLRQVRILPRTLAPSLVSRVKILSGLDIADRMRPQDGRARVAVRGAVVDLRVSTLPASHGEKVVIRVLDGDAGLRTLDAIGFDAGDLLRIRALLEQREGLVLVTGPTGSGKTTTLYAALREVMGRSVNVVTVEDPIEYRLPGIVQVQVHERAGLTFGSALRSIMRQDPDVILVGEIRDRETAEIAVQASLTGHLVLSTLHTNDAASAVSRLLDIGVAAHQIATAVKGVIAQRLVRRTCRSCGGSACPECGRTGFLGRRAIAEILVASPEFERRVAAGASTESIADSARANGCASLWDSGMALVRRSETTIDELRRVAAPPAHQVAEPGAPVPASAAGSVVRIGWWSSRHEAVSGGVRAQMTAAALGEDAPVEIVACDDPSGPFEPLLHALVILGQPPSRVDDSTRSRDAPGDRTRLRPLVLTLAPDGPAGEHRRMLARGADLVLPPTTHGRVVLATVLALMRWRSASRPSRPRGLPSPGVEG